MKTVNTIDTTGAPLDLFEVTESKQESFLAGFEYGTMFPEKELQAFMSGFNLGIVTTLGAESYERIISYK